MHSNSVYKFLALGDPQKADIDKTFWFQYQQQKNEIESSVFTKLFSIILRSFLRALNTTG
jgi:hypothetical protein